MFYSDCTFHIESAYQLLSGLNQMSSESISSELVPAISLEGLLLSPAAGLRSCVELKAGGAEALSVGNPGQDHNRREQSAEHPTSSLKGVDRVVEPFRNNNSQILQPAMIMMCNEDIQGDMGQSNSLTSLWPSAHWQSRPSALACLS